MGRKLPFKNRNRMRTLSKYKQNLRILGNEVWSYSTVVARIQENNLYQLGSWSRTTQNHINYVADELDLILIKD